jgi:hypothetical protein
MGLLLLVQCLRSGCSSPRPRGPAAAAAAAALSGVELLDQGRGISRREMLLQPPDGISTQQLPAPPPRGSCAGLDSEIWEEAPTAVLVPADIR